MPGYWVMRTDSRNATPFLWKELKNGRLRQGWGYDATQNLELIRAALQKGEGLTDLQASCWRGNRRLLSSERDGIREKDIIIVPHLPKYGVWSIVRVVGPYRYEIPDTTGDHGHVVPVTHRQTPGQSVRTSRISPLTADHAEPTSPVEHQWPRR